MPPLALPQAPALVSVYGRAILLDTSGEFHALDARTARERLREVPPALVIHAPATFRRLGIAPLPAYDVLELFLFTLPARRAAPSPRGLALALGLEPPPRNLEAAASSLYAITATLLAALSATRTRPSTGDTGGLAALMGGAGWGWAPFVQAALGKERAPSPDALRVWRRLSEWEELGPRPPPRNHPITESEARARLAAMLGPRAEARPGQSDYAAAVTRAFAPREAPDAPQFVLAEGGTGIGKTLGYLAPASLWAERNGAPVWISTYTRHLQRQVEGEAARFFPDPAIRRRHVVVRKGRENYLCLLNFVHAAEAALERRSAALIPLGLLARWLTATADGDLFGGDLPGWFAELFGAAFLAGLADRRGECIHAACPLFHRCFIEEGIRRSRTADLVIANHALTMTEAAWEGANEPGAPLRYVFDEGHHVFDAADAAFALTLSGGATAELRRWILGAETGRSRARGLAERIHDLLGERAQRIGALESILGTARALPAPGWADRLAHDPSTELFERANPTEAFLRAIVGQTLAQAAQPKRRMPRPSPTRPTALEADLFPPSAALGATARALAAVLEGLSRSLDLLIRGLRQRLEDEAANLPEALRLRIEAAIGMLTRRILEPVTAWREMLALLDAPPPDPGARPRYVTFLRVELRGGRVSEAALERHWLDPTEPFIRTIARRAHGVLVTSATLRDDAATDVEEAWKVAERRAGAPYLPSPPTRVSVQSPFDFAAQTRVFIVTDLAIGDVSALASAYRELFLAAGGGALGLFTAIERLVRVHALIAPALAAADIALYAQHVDAMDNATLADLFRTEEESCLLGTDAMRDGLDVPGRALRLVVFEKVPWARPDILHRERRRHLSCGDPKSYDDRLARLRLRQAFGRLIRARSDRGAFVLLDRRTPSRLLTAFPTGVVPRRAGLAEVISGIRSFLTEEV